MGLMTSSEANACVIIIMDKRVKGSDVSWVIGVNDTDGNYYDVELTGLGDDPEKSAIKTAVAAELVKMEKQPPRVVTVITSVEDKGLGETIG
jgi:hypothetical protein